jgi:hypothetical protein
LFDPESWFLHIGFISATIRPEKEGLAFAADAHTADATIMTRPSGSGWLRNEGRTQARLTSQTQLLPATLFPPRNIKKQPQTIC